MFARISSMSIPSILRSLRGTFKNHGACAASYDFAIRTLNRCVYYKDLRCFVVDKVDTKSLDLPARFRFMSLDDSLLLELAKQPENELDARFVRYALHKGDQCYGIFDGDSLANYGWYSRKATLMDNEELFFHFDPRFVYMYKGFTLEKYRGLRLHAISKTRALAEFLSRGAAGMFSYVESNNVNSIKSSRRMGARPCGRIQVARLAGRYFVRPDARCREYGLTMKPVSASPPEDSLSLAIR